MENIKNIFFPNGVFELNDFNRNIINSAPMSVMVVNKKGDIVFVNDHFDYVSSEKSPLFKNIFKTKFFINRGLVDSYKKLLENGEAFTKENCASIDKTKYINIVAVPLKDNNGVTQGGISMAIDVTEAVTAKLKFEKLNSKLEEKVSEKTKELFEANKKLEKSIETRLKFISDASHELRTPLAIAKLNLEFFKKQLSDKTELDILTNVDNEINKVSDILSDISFFTSIEGDTAEKIITKKINLTKLIENSNERLKFLADAKNINISLKKADDAYINGDQVKLEKLFLNLIGNAIKYGKRTGWVKIWFELADDNKSIKIFISDNGIGIPKKDLPNIFDKFYRANVSKKTGEGGFGLGLAACKWIVQQHNGSIFAKSDFGKGSVFTVVLPVE